MKYTDLKKQIKQLRNAQIASRQKLLNLQTSRDNALADLNSSTEVFQRSQQESKEQALNSYIREQVESYQTQIEQLEQEKVVLSARFKESIQELQAFEQVDESTFSKTTLINDSRMLMDSLEQTLELTISPRFIKQLQSQTSIYEIKEDDLESIITMFQQERVNLSHLPELGRLTKTMHSLEGILTDVKIDTSDQTGKIKLAGLIVGMLVLFFIAFKFIFPVYVILLFLYFIYLAYVSCRLIRVYNLISAVRGNIEQVESSITEKAEKLKRKKRKDLEDNYNKQDTEIVQKIDNLTTEMQIQEAEARKNFVFNDVTGYENYQLAIQSKKEFLDNVEEQVSTEKKNLQNITEELEQLNSELQKQLGTVQEEYLNPEKVGSNLIYDSSEEFLVDIDVSKNKPKTIKLPDCSTLYIYDEVCDVNDFIKLMCFQLRTRLQPTSLNITLVDLEFIGRAFLPFTAKDTKDNELLKSLFKIITNTSELNDEINALNEMMSERIRNIQFAGCNSIGEYNLMMSENDSLTESYKFIFLFLSNKELIKSQEFKQLLKNGECAGIYLQLFVQKDYFEAEAKNFIDITSSVEEFRVIKEGNIARRAGDIIIEKLKEASELKT